MNASGATQPPPLEEANDIQQAVGLLEVLLDPSSAPHCHGTLARAVTPQLRFACLLISGAELPLHLESWERCDVSEEEEETNWSGSSSNSSRHRRAGSEFASTLNKKKRQRKWRSEKKCRMCFHLRLCTRHRVKVRVLFNCCLLAAFKCAFPASVEGNAGRLYES